MSQGTTETPLPPAATTPEAPETQAAQAPKPKHYRWGFLSASLVILGLMIVGEAVGRQSERARILLADPDTMTTRAWISLIVGGLFLLCSAGLVVLQWRAVRHFFLSIKVGTSMIGVATIGVMAGVLVPQIDGFEDPEMRVNEANYEEQYKAFAFAEAYFLYHLTHLYGFGGPIEEAKQPPGGWEALETRLEEFGRKYGREEQKNREKEMRAAFANRAKMPYISGGNVLEEVEADDGTVSVEEVYVKGFVNEHEAFLRAFFDVSTALSLNRAYKSYWFKTLMILLATAVALNFLRMPVRKMFTIEKCGFAVVHLGMLVMLIGGGISNSSTDRGILHLDLREPPKNTYWRHYDRSKLSKMPFWVGLDEVRAPGLEAAASALQGCRLRVASAGVHAVAGPQDRARLPGGRERRVEAARHPRGRRPLRPRAHRRDGAARGAPGRVRRGTGR